VKTGTWADSDAEERKLGERKGLENPVVLAVNHARYPDGFRRGQANASSGPPGKYGRKAETQRNWRGPAQPVERVVQFETKRRTLPGFNILAFYPERKRWGIRKEARKAAAWLSSALAVRCTLQWAIERNPCLMLNFHQGQF